MARQFPARTRLEWAKIAFNRVISVLRRHRVCNFRQLESKIAEAGPPNIRAQPLSIKDGLAYLLEKRTVKIALPKNNAEGISSAQSTPRIWIVSVQLLSTAPTSIPQ